MAHVIVELFLMHDSCHACARWIAVGDIESYKDILGFGSVFLPECSGFGFGVA